ncbi:MAG: glycosyltransferase family 9 protein [Thermodesulfobacteriota bacterium]
MKALIIRPSALGDTLLLAPALYQIVDKVKVIVLGRKPGIDFLKPFLLDCLDYEKGGWHTLFFEQHYCKQVSFPDVDRIICFLSDPADNFNKGLRRCLKDIPIFSFPPFPQRGEKIHVAEYLASCLNKSGLPINPDETIYEARKKALFIRDKLLKSESTVVLHPGSGSKRKNYSPEFWLNLIRNKDLGISHTWILLLGPAEEERDQIIVKELSGIEIKIIHSPQKDMLLSLLKKASLYIGHDSGITHLAAMLGTRTICLFKHSDPLQWAPLGPDVTIITHDTPLQVIYKTIRDKLTTV